MIGEKIRIERVKKGYSQEYMSFMLNISQSTYSKIERDDILLTINRLYEIAELLDIRITEFLPDTKQGSVIELGELFQKWIKVVHFIRRLKFKLLK